MTTPDAKRIAGRYIGRDGEEYLAAILRLIASYERATTELRRANDSGDTERIWNAGNRVAITRSKMFGEARAIREFNRIGRAIAEDEKDAARK